jgi:hypothetical protein
VLDSLSPSPAIVKTATWDIVAGNDAATAVLTNGVALPAHERNVLRRLFGNPALRATLPDWEADARFAVAVFRVDVARSGSSPEVMALATELQATSEEFRRLWAENEVRGHWIGRKRLHHPVAGALAFETMAFAVDGAEGLSMLVFTPASAEDARAVQGLLARRIAEPSGR